MFRDEYNAVCNAAKNKVNLLEKNPVGYVAASFLSLIHISEPTRRS